jgi:hypothetical protein
MKVNRPNRRDFVTTQQHKREPSNKIEDMAEKKVKRVAKDILSFLEGSPEYSNKMIILPPNSSSGFGKVIFKNYWYEGGIRNGEFEGQGKLTHNKTGEVVEGIFHSFVILEGRRKWDVDGKIQTSEVRNNKVYHPIPYEEVDPTQSAE